jgi:hypothetical protein
MDKFIGIMLVLMIGVCLIGSIFTFSKVLDARSMEVEVFYDCRLAEISPDIPLKIKEECRHRMEKK